MKSGADATVRAFEKPTEIAFAVEQDHDLPGLGIRFVAAKWAGAAEQAAFEFGPGKVLLIEGFDLRKGRHGNVSVIQWYIFVFNRYISVTG
jgi:hypothetical protein